MKIDLTNEQALLIFTDQIEYLEGVHHGDSYKCSSVRECPLSHFDEDIEDIILRRTLMDDIMKAIKDSV